MNEQTELRALADAVGAQLVLGRRGMVYLDADAVYLLRRAADRLDRLNAYCAAIEEHGDVL